VPYFVAVLVAAWYGGFGAGIGITALAALVGHVGLSVGSVPGAAGWFSVPTLTFVSEGLAFSWLAAGLARERSRALAGAHSAREAKNQLDAVFQAIGDGITVQDQRGVLVYANEAAARVVGFSSVGDFLRAPLEEVMQRFELFDATGAPLPIDDLPNRTLLLGGSPRETLVQFRQVGSPEPHWSLVNAHGVFGGDGALRFVVNVFRDVTEQQRQARALGVSREWFSTALRSIGDAVIATDAAGTVTFLNPVAEQLTGWSSADAAGSALSRVFAIVNESTRSPVESPVDLVLRCGLVAGPANHTLLIRRDGAEIAIDHSAAPIRTEQGELVGVVLVFRDVTAERRATERRDFLARATVELNSSLDYAETLATVARLAVPRIADWSAVDVVEDGELRRLAVAHVDASKVKWVKELQRRYPPDPDAERGVPQVLRTGRAELMSEIPQTLLEAVARDPEHLRLIRELSLWSYIGVPISRGGQTFGVISLVMAESKRSYTQDDLQFATALADRAAMAIENARLFRAAQQARTDAISANQAKDDFLAMLGHELRNPLAPIVTALEVMRQRPQGNLERERSVIERQVRHVVRLVDDLLDVSRIIRGRVELAEEPVDVADVVNRAMELAGPLLEERRHDVRVSVPPGLTILGDAIRLTQVLTNLLTNGAKYTPPGGCIQVQVTVGDGKVRISVRDNGMGIAPDMLSRIFELFVQAPQTIDRSRGGLGLGLTIVQSLVKSFGGSVTAHSPGPGQGSEFVVQLPLLGVTAQNSDVVDSSQATSTRRKVSVMVVDDNVDALEMLVEALRLLGHDAHPAADAESALALAETLQPRIALLDIGLPLMDGYQLGQKLRGLPNLADIKLVALTGYGQTSDRERSRDAGFSAHLVKPVDLVAVDALLNELTAD
jgi:PAS domain S-box-containing protein